MNAKRQALPVFLAAALPIVINLALIICLGFAFEQKRSLDLMHSYAESVANGVYSFFVDAATVAAAASTLHSAQELDWQVLGQELIGFMRSERIARFVRRISLIDTDGYAYDAYATGLVGNRWQGWRRTTDNNDPYAQALVMTSGSYNALVKENERGVFSVMTHEPFIPDGLADKALITSAPIIKEGKSIGVIGVTQTTLELSHLYEDLTTDFLDKFGSKAHLFLVSQEGQILSNLDYNETYGAYMDKLFGRQELIYADEELGEDALSAVNEAVQSGGQIIEASFHGLRHLMSGARIPDTPFAVCLAVSKGQMLHSARDIVIIAINALLLALAAAGAALFGWRARQNEGDGGKPRRPKPPSPPAPKGGWGLDDYLEQPVLPPEGR